MSSSRWSPQSAADPRLSPAFDPKGLVLGLGEEILVADRLRRNPVARYLRTEIVLTNRRLIVSRPSAVLGLAPLGHARTSVPIGNVQSITVLSRFGVGALVLAALAALVGFVSLFAPNGVPFGLFVLVLALLTGGVAFGRAIEVQTTAGPPLRLPVSALDRQSVADVTDRLSEALARAVGAQRRGPSESSESDPSSALRQLNRLRDEGLISSTEYAAKRTALLSRL